jgi:hypothetical protein
VGGEDVGSTLKRLEEEEEKRMGGLGLSGSGLGEGATVHFFTYRPHLTDSLEHRRRRFDGRKRKHQDTLSTCSQDYAYSL